MKENGMEQVETHKLSQFFLSGMTRMDRDLISTDGFGNSRCHNATWFSRSTETIGNAATNLNLAN